jgi:hypothetical protein
VDQIVIELRQRERLWEVTRNGSPLGVAARLLRADLQDPAVRPAISFVGLEPAELDQALVFDRPWARKRPEVEVRLFSQAETYLELDLMPDEEAALAAEYRRALTAEDWDAALDAVAELGDRQCCTNPFWRLVERLAAVVWTTEWMTDRREQGRVEAKLAEVRRRASGRG